MITRVNLRPDFTPLTATRWPDLRDHPCAHMALRADRWPRVAEEELLLVAMCLVDRTLVQFRVESAPHAHLIRPDIWDHGVRYPES
jgi:hypothetical protein